jgi:dTDP-4-dehydrorhamnose 3,5-epimerase
MIFTPLELPGAWLIRPELITDERGAFARTWCSRELQTRGLNPQMVQCNISFNIRRGTVRGMHFQRAPHAETKLVRCTHGAIQDVIVDIRADSPTFGRWLSCELSADNRAALYVPEGFAHGFQTLTDNAEVFYQMSREHHPGSAAGLRWNDPAIDIRWPLEISVISAKDQSWPDLAVGPGLRRECNRTLDQAAGPASLQTQEYR